MSHKLHVINLFGAPGVGKSAAAAGLFWLMKSNHLSVEYVSEYAKYLVLAGRQWQLKDEQLYLFAKQHHKQLILRDKYEFAITDSPLQLCSFYAKGKYPESYYHLVDDVANEFENSNFFLYRDVSGNAIFEEEGRIHDRSESQAIETEMRAYLDGKGIKYIDLPVCMETPWLILNYLRPDCPPCPFNPEK